MSRRQARVAREVTRAVLYLRVSTEEQAAEGTTSLDDQERRCREFAQRKGWDVVAVYADEGFTGTKGERPEWDRLMADAKGDSFGVVCTLNWKRLARNARVGLNLSYDLEGLGVALAVVEGDFDTSSKEGRLFRTQMLGFAEFDRDSVVEQMANGQRAKARLGGWPGGQAAYGYRIEGHGRDAWPVLHRVEADMLRLVVGWIVDEGVKRPTACLRLNALGYRQRNGKPWHPDNLRDVLKNPSLKGEVVWAGSRRASGKYGDPITIQLDQAVLTPERWEALQRATSPSAQPPRGKRPYPLGSRRATSPCGATYGGACPPNWGVRVYRCRNARWSADPTKVRCGCPVLRADALDDRVWSQVRGLLQPSRLRELANAYLGLSGEGGESGHSPELATIRAQVARLERSLTETVVEYARQGLPAEAVRAATDAIQADLAQLRARQGQLEATTAQTAVLIEDDRLNALEVLAKRATKRLATAPRDTQAEVLGLLHVQVTVLDTSRDPALSIRGEVPVPPADRATSPDEGRPWPTPGCDGPSLRVPFSLTVQGTGRP